MTLYLAPGVVPALIEAVAVHLLGVALGWLLWGPYGLWRRP